jgi:hypothetical protein
MTSKVVPVLVNEALRHEDVSITPPFLISALDGGDWPDSHHCSSNPGGGAPGTHWIGGWVGPITSLDAAE